jgi:hypothetical protein
MLKRFEIEKSEWGDRFSFDIEACIAGDSYGVADFNYRVAIKVPNISLLWSAIHRTFVSMTAFQSIQSGFVIYDASGDIIKVFDEIWHMGIPIWHMKPDLPRPLHIKYSLWGTDLLEVVVGEESEILKLHKHPYKNGSWRDEELHYAPIGNEFIWENPHA